MPSACRWRARATATTPAGHRGQQALRRVAAHRGGAGVLRHAGVRLPGSRSLAADLGISRGTAVQAYAQLVAEGWLTGTTGSGTRVADLPGPGSGPAGAGDDPAPAAARLAVDLRPGRPDLSSFPRTDWASSVRRALAAAPYEDLDYAAPAGLPASRAA